MPPTNIHPQKITDRHHRLAVLRACGYTQSAICKDMGYTPSRVSVLCNWPEIQTLIQKYRDEYFAGATKSLEEEVIIQGGHTLDRLKLIRDQDDDLGSAVRACDLLFKRQLPEKTKHEEERTVKIYITHSDAAEMEHANQKMKVLDATFKRLE